MEYNLSQAVFDVKDIPADLMDCFESAACKKCYVCRMVDVFREVRRVLRKDGTLWLNLGDTYSVIGHGGNPKDSVYQKQATNGGSLNGVIFGRTKPTAGLKPKDLVGIPWLVAFALRADGWYLRSDIIWSKPNPMPESVQDRPTKAHEYIFLMSKEARYYYDAKAIAEPASTEPHGPGYVSFDPNTTRGDRTPGNEANERLWGNNGKRNRRSVWSITTEPFPDAHFATFPTDLVKVCLMAGSKPGDVILDPFMGSGTVAVVAKNAGRNYVGIELNPAYITMAEKRLAQEVLPL